MGVLIFLWTLVLKNVSGGQSTREIASYFLIAVGIGEIVMAKWGPFGSLIANSVRYGKLSNYLIKPTPIIPFLYFSALGGNGLRVLLAAVSVIVGFLLNPPQTIVSVLLFITFLISSAAVAFAYNLFLGTMYFHLGEASGIKNSIEHISRVLSGTLVPLTFFPKNLQPIVRLLPFQVMVYGPTNAIHVNSLDAEVIQNLVIAFFWAIFLNVFVYSFWKRSIKNYEASGI